MQVLIINYMTYDICNQFINAVVYFKDFKPHISTTNVKVDNGLKNCFL